MATLYDILPDSTKATFPLTTLTPKWQQRLSSELPPDYPQEYAAKLSTGLAERMHKMTVVHQKVRAVQRAMSGQAPPVAGPTPDYRTQPSARLPGPTPQTTEGAYPGLPAWQRTGLRLAEQLRRPVAGIGDVGVEVARSFAQGPGAIAERIAQSQATTPAVSSQSAPLVPPARPWTKGGAAEHVTDIVGGLVPFAAGAAAGGVPGMAAVAGMDPGTPVQRLVRAGTTALAGRLSELVTPAIAGEAPGIGRTLASHAPGAALFGAQPWASAKLSEALGQPAEGITADQMIQSGLEQFLISGALHGVGHAPEAVADAARAHAERSRMASRVTEPMGRGLIPAGEAARQASMGLKPSMPAEYAPGLKAQLELLGEAARAPKGMDFKAQTSSELMSKRLNESLAGKTLRVKDPDTGKELVAKVHSVFVYRHGDPEAGARHVRVIAEDASGHLAPLHYKTVDDFTRSVLGPYEGPEMAPRPAPEAAPPKAAERVPDKTVPAKQITAGGSLKRPDETTFKKAEPPKEPEPLPTTYQSKSKGEMPINRMASEHLLSAHAKAPDGAERDALGKEIARRNLTPKPRKSVSAEQPKLELGPGEGRREPAPVKTVTEPSKPIPPPSTPKLELEAPKKVEGPKLPQELAGARPRYNFGQHGREVTFESDIDKAAFITSQEKKSARDLAYRHWLRSQGMSEADIAAHGAKVRAQIKTHAKNWVYLAEGGKQHIATVEREAPKAEAPKQTEAPKAEEPPKETLVGKSGVLHHPTKGDIKGDVVKETPTTVTVESATGVMHTADRAAFEASAEKPKRTGEPNDADIEAALEKHHPGGLKALEGSEMSDAELDAAVNSALKADGWEISRHQTLPPVGHEAPHPNLPVFPAEDAAAVLSYHGKTSDEMLSEIAQNGTPDQKYVAKRVREVLQERKRSDVPVNVIEEDMDLGDVMQMFPPAVKKAAKVEELVDLADEILKMQDEPGARGMFLGARGNYPERDAVFLNGVSARRRNVGRQTALHEQIHNAINSVLAWAQEKMAFDPKYTGSTPREVTVLRAHRDLNKLFLAVVEEVNKRRETDTLSKEHATLVDESNSLKNTRELVTWGNTDSRMQDLLESIAYRAHKDGWSAYVNVMRRFLGLEPNKATALSELLRVSDQILVRKVVGKGSAQMTLDLSKDAEATAPRYATESLRSRLKVKRKLEQTEMEGLGPLSKGEGTTKKSIADVSDKAVRDMLTESASFHGKFVELLRDPLNRETAPITVAEEAARELGTKVPEDFDPNLEAMRVRAKALAEAGQGDVFASAGVEIPKQKPHAEEKQTAKAMATDAAAQTVEDAGGEHLEPPKMRRMKVSDLSVLPGFQKREGVTEDDLVNPRVVQQHLEPSPKNPGGGYNQDLIDQSPVTVWTDKDGTLGEKGKTYVLDGHHRRFLAGHTFGKKGEEYVVTGKADREMNAVEVFVTPEQAQQIAEFANRRTARTSYVEDAKLASRLMDEGKSVKEIAATLGTKQSEAERAAYIGKLDQSVREFFSDEALRMHGGHLGKAVAAHPDYFNAARQRQAMREINDGQHGSAIEFQAALKQESGLLDRLNQLDMGNDFGNAGFTPAQVKEATHRGLRFVERIKDALSKQLAALKAIQKAGGDASAVKLLHDKVSADRDRAKDLEKSLDPHKLFDRISKGLRAGIPAEKTLAELKAEIDAKLGQESPADQIPAGSQPEVFRDFEGMDPRDRELARAAMPQLWMDVLKGQPNAVRASIRRIPRGERLRTIDAQGRTVDRYDGKSLYEPDYYSESALVRLMAHAKLLGGNFVLPRDNAVDLKAGYSEEALHMHRWNWRRQELFGDKATRLMGPYSDNAKLVSRVLSGRAKPETLPPELRHVPDAIRTLTKEIFDHVNGVRRQMGLTPVKPLEGYDLPHMITGRASELVDSLLQSFLGGVDAGQRQKALEEMRNRFFEHRNQNERWLEDAALQIDAYISVMSRYAAIAPVLKRLGGDLARMEQDDPIRAGLVADWLKATLLRRKSKVDNILDNSARALFYAKNDPQAAEISHRTAAELLFPGEDSRLKARGLKKSYKRIFRVPAGVDYVVPPGRRPDIMGKPTEGSELILTDKFGRKYIGTQGEEVFTNVAQPKLRLPFELAGKAALEAGHALREVARAPHFGKRRFETRPEGMTGAEAKEAKYREWRQHILEASNSPGAAFFSRMGGNQMRSVLGWNFGAMIANWGQPWLTSAPEYGFHRVLKATARVSGGTVMRRLIDHAEKGGYLTKENADKWREVFQPATQRAMQIGSLQGEVTSAREQLAHPTLEVYQQLAKVLGPMYGYRVIEDYTRGVNVLGAEAMAKRYGLDPAVAWRFHRELNGEFFKDWAQSVKNMRTKGSTERLQAIMDSETMFDYNALGQAPIFGGTAGKLLGRLMTFPANYFPRYVSRPIGGALKVAGAVARGLVGKPAAARPERATAHLHAIRTENKYLVRGEYPAPMKAAERWLERHGAHYHDRQAAKVFLAQALTVGAMQGLTQATGVNALLPGTPGWDVLVLLLASSLDPHNPHLRRALENARKSAIISPERGVEVGSSPTMRLLFQQFGAEGTGEAFTRAQKRAKQGRTLEAVGELGRVPGEFAAEFLREQVPGMVAFRRSIQNAVEMGPVPSSAEIARTAVPDIVGTRSYVKNRDVGEMVKGNLRLTPSDEEAHRRKIIRRHF